MSGDLAATLSGKGMALLGVKWEWGASGQLRSMARGKNLQSLDGFNHGPGRAQSRDM